MSAESEESAVSRADEVEKGTPSPSSVDSASSSPPATFEEALRRIYAEKLAIMQNRQRKYGPGNIDGTGLVGCATRIRDKWERFWRFVTDADITEYPDESTTDTLIDMGNYADIALMLRRGWWGLPMEKADYGIVSAEERDLR